jgi:hypothetical protein
MAWILLLFEGLATFETANGTTSHAPSEYCDPWTAESHSAVAV